MFAPDAMSVGSISLALWLLWIVVLVLTALHIILRRDIRWRRKILWMIAVVLFPLVAVAAYVLVWLLGRRRRVNPAHSEPT